MEIRNMHSTQKRSLVLMLMTLVVLIARHKHKKLITIENKPNVKKLIGQVKNCKIGLIKKLIRAKTNRKTPNVKKSPSVI
jgi:hypothetical protein